MFDEEIDVDFFVETEPKEVVINYIKELQNWVNWYKMWHKKFQKENEKLTTELETYRPTKLDGEGLTACHKCKRINWTSFGFYHYKGQTLCDKCLKEVLSKENKNGQS